MKNVERIIGSENKTSLRYTKKVFKKKPKMLEEQIRDEVPQDSKSEEEKNEEV